MINNKNQFGLQMIMAVGFAGALGALLRYAVFEWIIPYSLYTYPLYTLVCNLLGCLILGWFSYYILKRTMNSILQMAITVGLIGSFTTFSAFSAEMMNLIQKNQLFFAFSYLWISLLGGLLCSWLGYRMAIHYKRMRRDSTMRRDKQ